MRQTVQIIEQAPADFRVVDCVDQPGDEGFTVRRCGSEDIKRLLGVYYEQNVTTEKYEENDGDRWIILGE